MIEIDRHSVLDVLSRHVGIDRGVKGEDLVREIVWRSPTEGDKRKFRKVIETLRKEGHVIVATPETGYFIPRDRTEAATAADYLLKRLRTSAEQIKTMTGIGITEINGQLRLKT
jgi:hypothetical protein